MSEAEIIMWLACGLIVIALAIGGGEEL